MRERGPGHGRSPAAALRERGREGRDRWRENGLRGLAPRQRRRVVLAAVVVLALFASLLLATVNAVVDPPARERPAATVGTAAEDAAPALAAGVAVARLVSSDRSTRFAAYVQDVDPDVAVDVQEGFEPAIPKILAADGADADATLRTVPLGYQVAVNDGRLAHVRLWARQEIGPARGEPTPSYLVYETMMRWDGERWRLYAYTGREAGPGPGEAAADAYTLMSPAAVEGGRS